MQILRVGKLAPELLVSYRPLASGSSRRFGYPRNTKTNHTRRPAKHIPSTPSTRPETDAERHRPRPDQFFSSAAASFPVRELTYFLDGGAEQTRMRERFEAIVEAEPVFRRSCADYSLSRPERYRLAMRKQLRDSCCQLLGLLGCLHQSHLHRLHSTSTSMLHAKTKGSRAGFDH